MFSSYASTLAKTSGLKSITEMFAALSNDVVVANNDHSFEQTLVANLAAIKLRESYDVVEGTFDAYLKDALHETIRNNMTNPVLQNKVINIEKDEMAVVFSQRIVNQFAQIRFADFKNASYSISTEFMAKAVADMDLDLNVGTLRQFFSGISEEIKDEEMFSLEVRVLNHSNSSLPLLQFNDQSTVDAFYGMQVDVLDNSGKLMFTVSMDVDMLGHVWYDSKSMDFKDLKFMMSQSKVLTEGVAHKSTSNMFYSATSNFIERYISNNFNNFVKLSDWDKIVDNKIVRVSIKKTYLRKGLLSFKLATYWKKDMDAILSELKTKKN